MRRSEVVWVALIILVAPSDAWAWGPAAHVDYGLEILKNAALLTPAVRSLLLAHADDYLYGCCAADIVVGKNWAPELHHCHNWQVAFGMLGEAREERRRALVLGFMTHLAVDVVAHNFYVPYKTVESFRARTAKHSYWELRFDRAVLMRPGVWEALRRVARGRFKDHDAFLGARLRESSRMFSFVTSKKIFGSWMFLSRLRRWQSMIAGLSDRSALPLEDAELDDFRRLSVDAAFAFLIDLDKSRTVRVDPTGTRSLRVAQELRSELRGVSQAAPVDEARWGEIAADVRRRFREGIYGRLEMPHADALLRP
jgi:hypothetical protein